MSFPSVKPMKAFPPKYEGSLGSISLGPNINLSVKPPNSDITASHYVGRVYQITEVIEWPEDMASVIIMEDVSAHLEKPTAATYYEVHARVTPYTPMHALVAAIVFAMGIGFGLLF